MGISVTVLCENCAGRPGLMGEHGFSALIEGDNRRILFDTGPGLSLPHNTRMLNQSLAGVDAIFISHGHYDHTGGLKYAVEQIGPVDVYAHSTMFVRHMGKNLLSPEAGLRAIGCPHSREDLARAGARFHWIDTPTEVFPGVWYLSGIERKPGQIPQDPQLVLVQDNQTVPDPMADDASLLLETSTGPVLILGCAHAGVLNILDHLQEQMGINRLRAILGGTHLMFFPPDMIAGVIDRFESFSIQQVAVSHCTGMRAAIQLGAHFQERFAVGTAGSVFDFA